MSTCTATPFGFTATLTSLTMKIVSAVLTFPVRSLTFCRVVVVGDWRYCDDWNRRAGLFLGALLQCRLQVASCGRLLILRRQATKNKIVLVVIGVAIAASLGFGIA
jgi:hypothetical protein